MTSATPERRPVNPGVLLGIVALIIVAAMAAFWPALSAGFLNWDDDDNIFQNPHLHANAPGVSAAYFWRHAYFELYMPVTYSIWAFLASVSRLSTPVPVLGTGASWLDPQPFHLLGLVLHAVNAALVFLLLRRLVRSDIGAAAGALLFAVHPVQTESVAWATGHNNVYSGLFALLALNLYAGFAERSSSEGAQGGGLPLYILATLAMALALLAKPTAVAVPLVALALDALWLRPGQPRRWLLALLPWFLLAAAMVLITRSSSGTSAKVEVALWARPIVALDALAFYALKVVAPLTLTLDYGRTPARVTGHWWGYANALLALTVLASAGWLAIRKNKRALLLMLALFTLGVLPMLGLVPFYFQRMSTVSDRYLYLALLGPAFGLAYLLSLPRATRGGIATALRVGVAVFLLLFGAKSWSQARIWHDSKTLFSHAVVINPESGVAYNNLGLALSDLGQKQEALECARKAAAFRPDDPEMINNLGVALAESGDLQGASQHFAEAVRLKPDHPQAHYHLGAALAELGDVPGAIREFREAARLQPDFEEAWFRLGVLLGQTGATDEGIAALRRVAERNPGRAEARYILGVLLGNLKKNVEAEQEFVAALQTAPEYAPAHFALGRVRERLGRPAAEVIAPLREAVRLDPKNLQYQSALRAAEQRKP